MAQRKRLRIQDIPREWITDLFQELDDPGMYVEPDQIESSFVELLKHRYNEIPPRYKRELEHFMDLETCNRVRRSRKVYRYGHGEAVYDFAPCDEMQVIFIHIPKTAGESIAYSLFGTLGVGHVGAESLHRVLGPDFWNFFVFTFVRNPFSRLVSAYEYLRRGGHPAWENNHRFAAEVLARFSTFEAFVDHMISVNADFPDYAIPHFRPQANLITLDGQIVAHFIGHFETLTEDIQLLGERLGREIRLEPRNVSPPGRRETHEYFASEQLRQKVVDFYRVDFETFRYSLDPWALAPI